MCYWPGDCFAEFTFDVFITADVRPFYFGRFQEDLFLDIFQREKNTSRIAEGRMTRSADSMSEQSIFIEFSGMLLLTPFLMQCMPASVHRAIRSAPT